MKYVIILAGFIVSSLVAKAQLSKWNAFEIEADTLMERAQYEDALNLYTQAILISELKYPESYQLVYKRSICNYSLNRFGDALTDISDYINLKPDVMQATLLKAYIGRELNNTGIQLAALNNLILSDVGNVDLLKWRASIFLETEKYEEARFDIAAAKRISNDAELETYLGISYHYQSESDSAIYYFDKAIALDDTYLTSYIYAASLSLDEEAYDLALAYLNSALQLDPTNLTLKFYKGIALVEKNDLQAGCSCLSRAFAGGIDDAGDYLKAHCYTTE